MNRLILRTLWMPVLVLGLAMPVAAQPGLADDTVQFTFSGPVEVPGVTLPPGTYRFREVDSNQNNRVVQIWDVTNEKIVATTLTIPARRYDPEGDVVIRFAETPADTPPAIKAWFYPGNLTGHEFVYPKSQADRIASTQKTLVLSADSDATDARDLRKATLRMANERGLNIPWTAGAADWRNDAAWTNPPRVVSGEDIGETLAMADGGTTATSTEALIERTRQLVETALEDGAATGDSDFVTVSRGTLEQIAKNLDRIEDGIDDDMDE